MKNLQPSLPMRIIHHDSNLLIVQTLTHLAHAYPNKTPYRQSTYGDFNLGLHVADNASTVLQHRCQLLAELCRVSNTSISTIHWLNQVHGNAVYDIDSVEPRTKLSNNTDVQHNHILYKPVDADALTTVQQGQALAIMTADCVPIILSCKKSGRIAGIHAGWHGLAKGVIAEAAKKFNGDSNVDTDGNKENIQAWIGACISQANYEVTMDVLDKLIEGTLINFTSLSTDTLLQAITEPHTDPNKVWIDLPQLAKIQLQILGIEIITKQLPCSYADNNYYSHRFATHLQQKHTGRMAMLVCRLLK